MRSKMVRSFLGQTSKKMFIIHAKVAESCCKIVCFTITYQDFSTDFVLLPIYAHPLAVSVIQQVN